MTSLNFNLPLYLILFILLPCHSKAEIIIEEIQPLKFPSIIKNLGSSTIVLVNWKGGIGKATNSDFFDHIYHAGKYKIYSDTEKNITINITSINNNSGIKLKSFKVRYKNKTYKSFPTSALKNPGTKGATIKIGAKMVANKNTTPGSKQPQYLIQIDEL
ncbi:hypothetical protein [Aliivibrio kagoshimensis]|uniref:hypothetical protein n=1 Tax=Aliivibrio kagoshimensis TaxID=2910230 RepID=UPI003D128658